MTENSLLTLHMKRNGFTDTGSLACFCIAHFIEKKWVRFEAAGSAVKAASAESAEN